MTGNNNDFETFARARLDESVDAMDGATRTRLAAMRREALISGSKSRGWMLPASLAMATAAIMLIWMLPQQQAGNGFDMAMEDIELLASDIDMDLLEDVEFYQWLEDNNHAG